MVRRKEEAQAFWAQSILMSKEAQKHEEAGPIFMTSE